MQPRLFFRKRQQLEKKNKEEAKKVIIERLILEVEEFTDQKHETLTEEITNLIAMLQLSGEEKSSFFEKMTNILNFRLDVSDLKDDLDDDLEAIRDTAIEDISDDLLNEVIVPSFHLLGLSLDQFSLREQFELKQELKFISSVLLRS